MNKLPAEKLCLETIRLPGVFSKYTVRLAGKVNLNRTTLQKVFKEMYGLTINEYRTKARLQLAKNLLVSTELSITEIAGRCGYANASKFSEVFKKNEGLLPKDWRK